MPEILPSAPCFEIRMRLMYPVKEGHTAPPSILNEESSLSVFVYYHIMTSSCVPAHPDHNGELVAECIKKIRVLA
ncbi:unnamed protein product [Larinioides sclopetarius]|uniref:Uncharacterized protein n=1 Tax=Larinioides sclopetarius TaxID=280406 RepID=A0AAV1YVY0_9ARAC